MAEREFAVGHVHQYHVALFENALQQLQSQRILNAPLDGAFERTRAEVGVVADLRQEVAGGVGDLQPQVPLGEPVAFYRRGSPFTGLFEEMQKLMKA